MKFIIELNRDEMAECILNGAIGKLVSVETVSDDKMNVAELKDVAEPVAMTDTAPVEKKELVEDPTVKDAIPEKKVATAEQVYSLDDIAVAATALMDMGKMVELQALLTKYTVNSLPELDKAQYNSFVVDLRGLGAQI